MSSLANKTKIVVGGAALVNISKFSYSCVKVVLLLSVTFFLKAKEFEVCANTPRTLFLYPQ